MSWIKEKRLLSWTQGESSARRRFLRRRRRQEVILCRLRIGHTYGTHGHLLRGEERSMCSRCNEPVTVAHVLLKCRRYARKRAAHLRRISSTDTDRQRVNQAVGGESDYQSINCRRCLRSGIRKSFTARTSKTCSETPSRKPSLGPSRRR